MTNHLRSRLSGVAVATLLITALVGCSAQGSAPTQVPAQPPTDAQGPTTAPVDEQPAGSVTINPAWPWPAGLPRPSHPIQTEFADANAMGEGGVYAIEFTVPSLDAAQAYADSLRDAGLEWMLDGKFAAPESGETETSVVAMTEDYMCTLTVDTVSLKTSFSFIGTWK